ncbi:N-6 DNA methylase [Micromonospora humida]|uniref:N-6 DNA methylase n=1 Tax=Micromonospora humida TaxID=2809018 RepID=UPI0033E2E270
MQETATMTAAEIARLAGVGRAAVSNWRKRHPDFPAPVGGSANSPEFALSDVERWLRDQGKLPDLAPAERLWRHLAAAGGSPVAALAAVGMRLLAHHRPARDTTPPPGAPQPDAAPPAVPWPADQPAMGPLPATLLADIDALADDRGAPEAFDELWRCFSGPGPGRPLATPDDLADLMAGLAAVDGGTVLDPAVGSGATLRAAARAGCAVAYGQETDADLAALAGLWLALQDVPGEVRTGDSLRADAFAGRQVDAVVCHPPFGATNWGDDELGHDPRWIVGTTPRTEPELAWVQHALAHLRVGGHAVLLMPPAVASRRAGKRIRSELLRRGHLRAVIALPPGAAGSHGVPLHLWVLRRAAPDAPPPARMLLVDAAGGDLAETAPRVLAAWREFDAAPDDEVDQVGFARTVPVIELLDEDVDLTPARRQPAVGSEVTGEQLVRTRERLTAVVAALPELIPQASPGAGGPQGLTLTVGELVRSGALQLVGPIRSGPADSSSGRTSGSAPVAAPDGPPVLTVSDVLAGVPASGRVDDRLGQRVPLAVGDVVVPMVARELTARVVTAEGDLLGHNLYLLRPDPARLDPWFLAGQLRTTTNERQASSLSGTLRLDVRRAQVCLVPLDAQRAYGETVQRLFAFESALRQTVSLGADLVRLTADGLAAGSIRPDGSAR